MPESHVPDRSEIEPSSLGSSDGSGGCDELARAESTTIPDESLARLATRILFLDDDAERAQQFLSQNPHAVWVETARECIDKLSEDWEEVHLDHDLGGEHFVDTERDDCGMEVVRWLCKESRANLRGTRFVIHSHNLAAALVMVLLMRDTGYQAEFMPFGFRMELEPIHVTPIKKAAESPLSWRIRVARCKWKWKAWLRSVFKRWK